MTPLAGGWHVEHAFGHPAALHAAGLPDGPVRRLLRWNHADRDALVLGSAQPATDARHPRDAVRRCSGGGAVLVGPGRLVWADIIIPAGDELWDADVSRAPIWVGQAWADALDALDALHGLHAADALAAGRPTVHRGAMVRAQGAAAKVCFAGVGPGELLLGGRKVVGISQRRTRAGVLFQTAAVLRWDPADVADAMTGVDEADIRDAATGIDKDERDVIAALESAMP